MIFETIQLLFAFVDVGAAFFIDNNFNSMLSCLCLKSFKLLRVSKIDIPY